MKKILVLLLSIFAVISFIMPVSFTNAECTYDFEKPNADIWAALNKCLEWVQLVDWTSVSLNEGWWFSKQIKYWTNNIALYLWIFSVLSIIIGSFMMTISVWEEDKIKKAKDIVKWGMIWFIWVISVSAIINLVVKIMYSI